MNIIKALHSIRFFRYIFIGGLSAFFETSIFSFLHYYLKYGYLFSNSISILLASCFGYIGQKKFTFYSKKKSKSQIPFYLSQLTINCIISNTLMFIFISIFGIYAFVAKLMQLIIGVFFNYNFSRLVVFKDKK